MQGAPTVDESRVADLRRGAARAEGPGAAAGGNRRAGRMSSAHLVGRERELGLLVEALADPPALVLVEGEAGIGKSRLVHEALSRPAAGTRCDTAPLRLVASRRLLASRASTSAWHARGRATTPEALPLELGQRNDQLELRSSQRSSRAMTCSRLPTANSAEVANRERLGRSSLVAAWGAGGTDVSGG
jgi:hypothetical protein